LAHDVPEQQSPENFMSKSTSKKITHRPTIGFLLDFLKGTVSYQLWHGVIDVAQKRNINLVSLMPRAFNSPVGFEAQSNALYNLINADRLDGLLIWTSPIINTGGPPAVEHILRPHRSIPIVAIEKGAPEDIPRVALDDYGSMQAVIAHLIEEHGLRRIAFVRGPDETHLGARKRYQAYLDVLAEHHLPFDPELVSPPAKGIWTQDVAEAAVALLLDQRQVQFDAIVGANDQFARGAIDALQARDIYVPDQVAVVGFDNEEYSPYLTPPLTTVSLRSYDMGRQGLEMLLAMIEGEDVPPEVILPKKLIIRRSCGCLNPIVAQAAAGPVTISKSSTKLTKAQQDHILAEMKEAAPAIVEEASQMWIEQLLAVFAAELAGDAPGTFLSTLDRILRRVVAVDGQIETWPQVISALRRHTIPYVSGTQAEDLWLQAQLMVGEVIRRVGGYQAFRDREQINVLNEAGSVLITTFDVDKLMDVLADELPNLGMRGGYLSLYENPQQSLDQARLILAYDEERGRLTWEPGQEVFPSNRLAPEGILPQDRPYNLVVEALYFRENQLGFVLFDAGPRQGIIYYMLRDQISSALQGALLLQARKEAEAALEQAYLEVGRQVEERTAELQRETAERERLQQEMIEAQQRAIQELSTPIIPILEGIIIMPLIGSIDSLRARDITRALLAGIGQHKAKVVILDVTGVPLVDSGVASYLNKTIQAAQLKGTRAIITGISEAVAETIVDLGIDWSNVDTKSDLQTGLQFALAHLSRRGKNY